MRTWPRKVRDYDSRAAKLAQARALNDIRRHLDRNERRALIEARLKAKK